MLRKRRKRYDDRGIHRLVEDLLLPYARKVEPDASISLPVLRERLKPCVTYVYTAGSTKPVGFIALRKQGEVLNVDMLAVDARYQGRGAGGKLMQLADRTAKRWRIREIRLWVDEQNKRAQRFYTANGYKPVYFEPRIRCYLMAKSI